MDEVPYENPWIALDASTPPLTRARDLRRAWEHFIEDERIEAVRTPVAESWQRSRAAGVDPAVEQVAPTLAERDEAAARWESHPLVKAGPLVRDSLAGIAHESDHLIVVSDADGMLLWIDGNAGVRVDAADSMNFVEGTLWSEEGAGTNAIGTAMAADHALQIFAAEHFNELVQRWTCSAAPVHDPDDGRLLGVIDLTGLARTVHPHSLAVAMRTARAVESQLRLAMSERDARLRSRHEERIAAAGDQSALVTPSGRVLAQSPGRWLAGERLAMPAGGGELALPSGGRAVAEPVGGGEAFVVRGLGELPGHRAELRRQVIAAADAERARLARNLHDGAQQRLVHTMVTLKLSRQALHDGNQDAEALMDEALEQAERALEELRALAHGALPRVLARGGLRAAVEALASGAPLPVTVDVAVGRLADTIAVQAYFIIAEALTNVVKHSRASRAEVHVGLVGGDVLQLEVRDNGVGGARLAGGSGLLGLEDRVASLSGRLRVTSPPGGGTMIAADLPLPPTQESAERSVVRIKSPREGRSALPPSARPGFDG